MTLEEALARFKPQAYEALGKLVAVGAVVAGYWFLVSEAVEPPDPDSRVFLSVFALVAGAILAFLTTYLRDRFGPRPGWVAGLAVVAAVAGAFAWFTYEGHRDDRIADVPHRDGRREEVIVTNAVTAGAVEMAIKHGFCTTENLRPDDREVSFTCARRLAVELYGANWAVFDVEAQTRSRDMLIGWYRAAALAFMLALFFVVDAGAASVLGPRSPRSGQ